VDFELADQIYARATVKDANAVCLWLGANVMVEYSLEEVGSYFQPRFWLKVSPNSQQI
jgi:prefoldin subunit 5